MQLSKEALDIVRSRLSRLDCYPGETLRTAQLCKFSPNKEAYQENTKNTIIEM